MTTRTLSWSDYDSRRDLLRWFAAAAIVGGLHAALIGGYLLWHQPDQAVGDFSSIVSVELAPIDSVADANQRDIAPGPEDMVEQKPVPEVEKQPEQPKTDQPPPPPAATTADLAPPEPKPPEKVEEERPPAPRTAARVEGGAPRVAPSWQADLVRHLQQYKRYPSEAQAKGEQGVVVLGFSVDRSGRVLAHRIVQSSGHADLDHEVTEMIERAQPLPAFPPSMTQAQMDLTVPIRFSLR
jgi:periplasmic protein TonB